MRLEEPGGNTRNQASTKRGCNTNAVPLIWQVLIGDGKFRRDRRRVVKKDSGVMRRQGTRGWGGKAPIRNFIIIF